MRIKERGGGDYHLCGRWEGLIENEISGYIIQYSIQL